MATTVYHGTRISNIKKLMSGVASFPGLYVTENEALAARYANAQATGIVSAEFGPLAEHAAVVTLETNQEVDWRRRAHAHTSLDVCEATIKTWRIVAIEVAECSYRNCTCHKDTAAAATVVQP